MKKRQPRLEAQGSRALGRWCAVLLLAGTAALTASTAGAGGFELTGSATRVIDGETLVVRLANGKIERVRLLGIDTPAKGTCWSAKARAATSRLARGKRVSLVGDAAQGTRDRYGRLLAYVWLPGGKDLGFQLLADGHAQVSVRGKRFERLPAYRKAEAAGKRKGLWACGAKHAGSSTTPGTSPPGGCRASAAGPCLDPSPSGPGKADELVPPPDSEID